MCILCITYLITVYLFNILLAYFYMRYFLRFCSQNTKLTSILLKTTITIGLNTWIIYVTVSRIACLWQYSLFTVPFLPTLSTFIIWVGIKNSILTSGYIVDNNSVYFLEIKINNFISMCIHFKSEWRQEFTEFITVLYFFPMIKNYT